MIKLLIYGMGNFLKVDHENLILSNNYNKITVMELKVTNKVKIACHHLQFCNTKSD